MKGGEMACVAFSGVGTEVTAVARCCKLPADARCYYQIGPQSEPVNDATSEVRFALLLLFFRGKLSRYERKYKWLKSPEPLE